MCRQILVLFLLSVIFGSGCAVAPRQSPASLETHEQEMGKRRRPVAYHRSSRGIPYLGGIGGLGGIGIGGVGGGGACR